MKKVSPRVRVQAIELLLCAADLRLRFEGDPKKFESDFEFPVINAGADLCHGPMGPIMNLAWTARVHVLADMGLDSLHPKIKDEFVILEAAKRLEEGWSPS